MSIENIFISRIKILIGEGTPTAFGRKCGIDGKTVKSALEGKIPGQSILNKISLATGRSVEWIMGVEQNDNTQPIQSISEPPPRSIQKYEHLTWKFQHIFDFLLEAHEDDAVTINDFMAKLENDFLMKDPDYRLWMYQKREMAAKRQKKREAENNPDRPMVIKSANGEKS